MVQTYRSRSEKIFLGGIAKMKDIFTKWSDFLQKLCALHRRTAQNVVNASLEPRRRFFYTFIWKVQRIERRPFGTAGSGVRENDDKFLGAAAAASERPDKIGAHCGGLSSAASDGGAISVHLVSCAGVSGGRGNGVPILPGAGL